MNQHSNASYFECFNDLTTDGMVFVSDMSDNPERGLSADEIEQRLIWNHVVDLLGDHYVLDIAMQINTAVTTVEMLLQQRFSPPRLDYENASRSTANDTRLRAFPTTLHVWTGFETAVAAFVPTNPTRPLQAALFGRLFSECVSLPDSVPFGDEAGELGWITTRLGNSLQAAGLARIDLRGQLATGDPDFTVRRFDGREITIVCEAKATHSLRLPIGAQDTVNSYNQRNEQVCNPLGQLCRFMVDNNTPFGALTSSNRTYFVSIRMNGPNAEFRVSKAWMVGEENYLRAWTYVHSLGCAALGGDGNLNWAVVSSAVRGSIDRKPSAGGPNVMTRSRAMNNQGRPPGNATGNASNAAVGVSLSRNFGVDYFVPHNALERVLPFVSRGDIEIKGVIGCGRNGTVLKAHWAGQEVALKQFDLSKGGEPRFQAEATAYAKLQPAWGKLVPKPLFISESASGNVTFLGLQLGRALTHADVVSGPSMQSLVEEILQSYGVQLLDVRDLNFVFLPRQDGTEGLAVIDLEDHELVAFDQDSGG
jgi:hypothetical protein